MSRRPEDLRLHSRGCSTLVVFLGAPCRNRTGFPGLQDRCIATYAYRASAPQSPSVGARYRLKGLGWGGRSRTFNILVQSQTFRQLNYTPTVAREEGFEPSSERSKLSVLPLDDSRKRRSEQPSTVNSPRPSVDLSAVDFERARGIEPLSQAWKARAQPIYQARIRESRGSCNLTMPG